MDRNDAGIVRTMITICSEYLTRNEGGNNLSQQSVGKILQAGARLHDVTVYTTITRRLTRAITASDGLRFFTELLEKIAGLEPAEEVEHH